VACVGRVGGSVPAADRVGDACPAWVAAMSGLLRVLRQGEARRLARASEGVLQSLRDGGSTGHKSTASSGAIQALGPASWRRRGQGCRES
jgi:hypothetical protein